MPDAISEAIRPVWILLVVGGCMWSAAYSVIDPPPWRFITTIGFTGIVGAFLGQAFADAANLHDIMIGDTHIVAASFISFVAVVVVRRLVA